MTQKFFAGGIVKHVKTGRIYRILHYALFEHNTRPCYVYVGSEGVIWVRAAEEMEDGRFVNEVRS